MLTSLPVSISIGAILGFLTGLGTGGGSLLLLWLTLVCQIEPMEAKIINLMFFIPPALFSTILRSIKGTIPWKKLLLPTVVGCLAAFFVAKSSHSIDAQLLQRFFGVLLLCVGMRELLYQKKVTTSFGTDSQ